MEQRVPFLDARVSKRGAEDNNVEALEALVHAASRRVAGYGGESSPASIADTSPKGWQRSQSPRSDLGGQKRSGVVDFGGLEYVEFEITPELAERTTAKRIHGREATCVLDDF